MPHTPLAEAKRAAQKAGAYLARIYPKLNAARYKDAHSIVTAADKAAETIILGILRRAFPHDTIYSEEQGWDATRSKNLWVIDPLDGTSNFSHHIPYFAVSICLVQQQRVTMSVIYEALQKNLFWAERGRGAYCNGRRLHVGRTTDATRAMIAASRGATTAEKTRHGHIVQALTQKVRTIRILGTAAMTLVRAADGNLDASIHSGENFYDIAGGLLIAKEAGASVTDFRGRAWAFTEGRSDALVANPTLAKILLPTLKRFT